MYNFSRPAEGILRVFCNHCGEAFLPNGLASLTQGNVRTPTPSSRSSLTTLAGIYTHTYYSNSGSSKLKSPDGMQSTKRYNKRLQKNLTFTGICHMIYTGCFWWIWYVQVHANGFCWISRRSSCNVLLISRALAVTFSTLSLILATSCHTDPISSSS